MATTYMITSLLTQVIVLMTLIMNSSATTTSMDLFVAIQEMQTANYFTFVTLINMTPLDHLTQGSNNLTFLMPNDRTLAKLAMQDNSVTDFLLRHSIPSPMLFDHLQHIPSGSIIPSSKPDFMLKISNNGRRSYYLNNVKIISPNICTAGSSFRCHGIDGVLLALQGNITNPNLPTCSSTSSSSTSTPASPVAADQPPTLDPLPPFLSPNGPVGTFNPTTSPVAAAPPPMDLNASPKKSGSSLLGFSYGGLLVFLGSLSLPLMVFSI